MTIEERIKQLERVTARLARRSRKVAKAFITPYPIPLYLEKSKLVKT